MCVSAYCFQLFVCLSADKNGEQCLGIRQSTCTNIREFWFLLVFIFFLFVANGRMQRLCSLRLKTWNVWRQPKKKSNNLSAVDGDGGGRITFHTTSTCQKKKKIEKIICQLKCLAWLMHDWTGSHCRFHSNNIDTIARLLFCLTDPFIDFGKVILLAVVVVDSFIAFERCDFGVFG